MSLIIDEHRQYLIDRVRLERFAAAIAATVGTGDVVLDLGSGTGIMGLLACRAGAARVYSIESDSIAGLTRELAAANGYGDRMVVIRGLSTRVELPERATVLVTDQIGGFGFDAGFFEYVADARARLLTPRARTIPARIALDVAPCETPEIASWVEFWSTRPAGFAFDRVRPMAASTGYRCLIAPSDLLAPASTIVVLDPSAASDPRLRGSCEFTVTRDGTATGVAGWFRAELAPGVELTNAPHAPDRINRRHVVFPFDPPVTVAAGDRLRVDMRVWPVDAFVSWEGEVVSSRSGVTARLPRRSTFGGMLLAAEDLSHTRVDTRPRLTAAGRARSSVLQLADGTRPLAEIEQLMAERHRDILPTREAAAVFVAEVLTNYAE